MARPFGPLTAQIENVIRAEARGEPHAQILEEYFNLPPGSDIKEIRRAEQKMFRWRHRPDAQGIWEDELKATVKRRVPAAMSRIISQIDSNEGWLANKAANDVMLLAKTIGLVKTEETALKVTVEGMPDIGSPDQPE